jgi:hypothetical protein
MSRIHVTPEENIGLADYKPEFEFRKQQTAGDANCAAECIDSNMIVLQGSERISCRCGFCKTLLQSANIQYYGLKQLLS